MTAAPESSSVNINKNNNSFDMSFSAMYHGRNLGLETQFLKNQGEVDKIRQVIHRDLGDK